MFVEVVSHLFYTNIRKLFKCFCIFCQHELETDIWGTTELIKNSDYERHRNITTKLYYATKDIIIPVINSFKDSQGKTLVHNKILVCLFIWIVSSSPHLWQISGCKHVYQACKVWAKMSWPGTFFFSWGTKHVSKHRGEPRPKGRPFLKNNVLTPLSLLKKIDGIQSQALRIDLWGIKNIVSAINLKWQKCVLKMAYWCSVKAQTITSS